MPDIFTIYPDERDLAQKAMRLILSAYTDKPPYLTPMDIYEGDEQHVRGKYLDVFTSAVNAIVFAIMQKEHPDKTIPDFQIPAPMMKRIVWGMFGALKTIPQYEKYITGGIDWEPLIERENVYESFTLPPDYAEPGHIGMMHTRTLARVWEERQEKYNEAIGAMNTLLIRRYSLLEEFFRENILKNKQNIASHVEVCCHELDVIRRDFVIFCEKYGFENIFAPSPRPEISELDSALQWNEMRRQEEALESFSPSPAEEWLLSYMPKSFQQYEKSLFWFIFDTKEEIEQRDDTMEDAFREDMRCLLENQCVRKMLIAYHVHLHLMKAERWCNSLSSSVVQKMRKYLPVLEEEIEDCWRKLENQSGNLSDDTSDEGKLVTYDISHINDLAVSAANILEQLDVLWKSAEISDIIGQIGFVLHTCSSSAANIRTDEDLTDYDKAQIIRGFYEEALQDLWAIQEKIQSLDIADDSPETPALDNTQYLLAQAIRHLSKYV